MRSCLEPRLNHIGAVLGFPLFKLRVIATFCFDDFACVWIMVLLCLTRAARAFCRSRNTNWSLTTRSILIEESDNITQAIAILTQQPAQLSLEFDFALQSGVTFH